MSLSGAILRGVILCGIRSNVPRSTSRDLTSLDHEDISIIRVVNISGRDQHPFISLSFGSSMPSPIRRVVDGGNVSTDKTGSVTGG